MSRTLGGERGTMRVNHDPPGSSPSTASRSQFDRSVTELRRVWTGHLDFLPETITVASELVSVNPGEAQEAQRSGHLRRTTTLQPHPRDAHHRHPLRPDAIKRTRRSRLTTRQEPPPTGAPETAQHVPRDPPMLGAIGVGFGEEMINRGGTVDGDDEVGPARRRSLAGAACGWPPRPRPNAAAGCRTQ